MYIKLEIDNRLTDSKIRLVTRVCPSPRLKMMDQRTFSASSLDEMLCRSA